MGGKGGAAPPPEAAPMQDNSAAMMGMMMQMMGSMGQQQMPMPQQMPPPLVESTTPVDWESQMEDLGAKAKYDAESKERKGRISTIHSSLTDDDVDTEMKGSLLGSE